MPNINKVVYGGQTLIDLTDSTLSSADQLANGVTAYDRSGTKITGTASGGGGIVVEDELDSHGGTVRTITAVPVNLQSKSVTPSETAQTIEPDQNYTGLSSVSVGAIPSDYVGSAIDERDSTDLTASGATVSVPAGYYEAAASKSVASGTVLLPASASNNTASLTTGSTSLTFTGSVPITATFSAGYISSDPSRNVAVSMTHSPVNVMPAYTFHPSANDQTVIATTYTTGDLTIKGVTTTNLTAANIKSGVTVKVGDSTDGGCVTSVTGTYSGGSSKNMQAYIGYASRTANSYGATSVTLTVAKTGTYTISWCAWRSSSTGTMGTNLHIGSTAETANHQTWTGTYGQCITLTNQSLTQGTVLTLYATSGSNSRSIYVGNLIIEEE